MAYDPKLSWAGVAAALSGPGVGPSLNDGYLRIYDDTGDVPTFADDSNGSNVLLAELVFGSPAFGTASNGVLTANGLTDESAAPSSGTAAYGRCYKSDGSTCIYQGLCGLTASDILLDTLNIDEDDVVGDVSVVMRMLRE